ncbi:helix-turn-helix domain-containing protein [Mycobacterium sp.]|uniref:winged helix-turn-helix transcriptional regulator n=1 Tax=Mycobacterium sp. TaxID=1785 RepID=UPI002C30687F|nr:helix-turn-helix domain-containing protein [Mycobacterium sp.]HME49092.1 helix-turn-helix domain-containing protein [Mycobacterium sp.]
MRRASFADLNCSVAQTLEVVGDWWSLLIVRDVYFGVTRFDDIQRRLGIARNTLTDRLDWLCGHGVLVRVPYGDSGSRYEYRLTDKGRDLQPILMAMVEWGDKWGATADHRPLQPTDANGEPVELRIVNARNGRRVPPEKVRMVPTESATDPNMVPPAYSPASRR